MTRKRFRRGYHPEILLVRRDQELTGPVVRKFVPLQFASNEVRVFLTKIDGAIGVAIAALNDHAFGLDVKGRELFLTGGIVAGIDAYFDLSVQTTVNVCVNDMAT